jgi:hypothetical protein
LQLAHGPLHALLQQIPSAQKPLAHSSLVTHGSCDLMEQKPFSQGIPFVHWVSLVQELKHVPDAKSQR